MAVALTLASRACGLSAPNPNVGCVIVKNGNVTGRGWTQAGGRPHAEAMALSQAGNGAHGGTAYITLEPCAHDSARGPACADALIAAKIARVVIALVDPDPRTNGLGIARLIAAGIAVETGVMAEAARAAMAGWLMQQSAKRPLITLKLATSLDGAIATQQGESQWITGDAARAYSHVVRARNNIIIVGRGTYDADAPRLDVRLAGLEARSPLRIVLSRSDFSVSGWSSINSPAAIQGNPAHYALIEGGAGAAAAFLGADLIDRLLIIRAPILIGGGKPCLSDIGLVSLDQAHGCWRLNDARMLGNDRLEIYDRIREI